MIDVQLLDMVVLYKKQDQCHQRASGSFFDVFFYKFLYLMLHISSLFTSNTCEEFRRRVSLSADAIFGLVSFIFFYKCDVQSGVDLHLSTT